LPRNERATQLYRAAYIGANPGADPESPPYLAGPAVLIDWHAEATDDETRKPSRVEQLKALEAITALVAIEGTPANLH
jgi:hypothetical protein